jgi:hypothetical protein
MDCLFDSHADVNSIMVSTWAAMADIKFHGDVIFLFSPCCCCCFVVVVVEAKVSHECSAPRTCVENTNFRGNLCSTKSLFTNGKIPSMRAASKISLEGAPSREI